MEQQALEEDRLSVAERIPKRADYLPRAIVLNLRAAPHRQQLPLTSC
jgi:hypothetical protein